MSDDLRDRIAAALKSEAEKRGIYKIADFDFPFLADAVIRELNLERQDHYDPDCDYYRYVTDWIAEQTILSTAPGADFDGGIELTSTEFDEFLRLAREP